jgi:hypothetical protein
MSKVHNKKRNVGIIYELLLRNVSSALIENNRSNADKTLKLIETYFDKSTEIYREFRLFNALVKSTVSDSAIAAAILTEAKSAARRCNKKILDREKSQLIREINHNINNKEFYHRRVPEYKIYATIHTLLEDWRAGDRADLTRVVQYESRVVEWLLSEKATLIDEESIPSPDVDSLVVKIMTEKLNGKYTNILNADQRDIIREYVFSLETEDSSKIRKKLAEVKKESIISLNRFKSVTDNKILLEKIDDVRLKIQNECSSELCDESISRFLVLMNLSNELGDIHGR